MVSDTGNEPRPPKLDLHVSEIWDVALHGRAVPRCNHMNEDLAVRLDVGERVRQLLEEAALGCSGIVGGGPDPRVDLRAAPLAHRPRTLDGGARRDGIVVGQEPRERGLAGAAEPDEAYAQPIDGPALLRAPVG